MCRRQRYGARVDELMCCIDYYAGLTLLLVSPKILVLYPHPSFPCILPLLPLSPPPPPKKKEKKRKEMHAAPPLRHPPPDQLMLLGRTTPTDAANRTTTVNPNKQPTNPPIFQPTMTMKSTVRPTSPPTPRCSQNIGEFNSRRWSIYMLFCEDQSLMSPAHVHASPARKFMHIVRS